MKILIFGGSGFIGSKFVKSFVKEEDVFFTYNNKPCSFEGSASYRLDITNRNSVIELTEKVKPELVINTVAIPSMDTCEINKGLARKVNIEGTRNVIDACKRISSKIVFISTSAVFNSENDVYFEHDEPNPLNYHGFTHLEGERLTIESSLPFLIFRIDLPYGWVEAWQKKNSVTRIIEKLEAGEIVEEPVDWYNNPIFVYNLIDVSIKLIKADKAGIYHLVGPDFINRYELALKVAKIFNKDSSLVTPINSNILKLPAKRGKNNLDNSKAEKDSGIKLLDVEEGLNTMLKQKTDKEI